MQRIAVCTTAGTIAITVKIAVFAAQIMIVVDVE